MRLFALRLRNIFLKHRGLFIFLFILFVVVFIWKTQLFRCLHEQGINLSETSIGIIGTLLGAIVGGVFTLLGTIWIQKKQAQIQNDIRRSNTIYKPLYDELKQIHDVELKQYPFPCNVYFEKPEPFFGDGICYEVWTRIQSDSRYLEIPHSLKKQIAKLKASTEEYTAAYRALVNELDDTIKNISEKYSFPADIQIRHGGDIIIPLLENKIIEAQHTVYSFKYGSSLYESEHMNNIELFAQELSKKCQQLKQVSIVYEKRKQWDKVENDLIRLLAYMIQYSNIRNEG